MNQLNLFNHVYQTTLLVDITMPANESEIIQEIRTINFDRCFIFDTRADLFYEFYNIVENQNNKFSIGKGKISLGNDVIAGAMFYKETWGSENFTQDIVDSAISINFQLNYKEAKYMSYRITAILPDPTRVIGYIPNAAEFNVSQDKDSFGIMNGKFLLNPPSQYGSLCFTSQVEQPTLESQLITNQILNWNYKPVVIPAPYKHMSVHASLRNRDNSKIPDLLNLGDKCGVTELNSGVTDTYNKRVLYYFMHELPADFHVSVEFEDISQTNLDETNCHFYDQDRKYLLTAGKQVNGNVLNFINNDNTDKYFAIEFYSYVNINDPSFKPPKDIFLISKEVDVIIEPGYYNGLEGINAIYDLAKKSFKDNFGIDVSFSINPFNNYLTITTPSDEPIYFSFPQNPNSSNRFFGIYDSYYVEIDKSFKSPNHVDLFSGAKYSNICLVCDQLANSGYINEKNIILHLYPSDVIGRRINYTDITYFKNFMTNINLNYLTIRLIDGEGQPIINRSDIFINFKINCFSKFK